MGEQRSGRPDAVAITETPQNFATVKVRLRDRKGRYAEECDYCGCPAGCACDGEGCACGTTKPKAKRKGDGVTFDQIRSEFEKGGGET